MNSSMPARLSWGFLAAAILVVAALPMFEEDKAPVYLFEAGPIRERVIELPEDGGRWSTILVYEDGAKSAESRELASWMATTPRLQSLAAQTRHFEWTASNWWVRNYEPTTPIPFVLLLNEKSQRVYRAQRGNMPTDGEDLADAIQERIADCCPSVDPPKPAQPWQPKAVIPQLGPGGPKDDEILVVVLALLLGGGVAAWYGSKPKVS